MTRIVREEIAKQIRRRANSFCEYCRISEALSGFTFEVDHIIPRAHGSGDDLNNLAWACPMCNAYKGPNLSTLDPKTGSITSLFNPRREQWLDHFQSIKGH